jgi:UDP-glucose 4-epimerase
LTSLLIDIAGSGRVEYVDWPAEKKAIDIGSIYTDSSKFTRATGWTSAITLAEGLRRTVDFYRQHLGQYLDPRERPVRV